ncbi:MAG: hypothetical protein JWO06_4084 [Bacteroidota bacterium]|nr:hypothetical protein [Bacteroidota bacterium]
MRKLYAFILPAFFGLVVSGQSTYQSVYSILQTNCTGSCHTSSAVDGIDFTANSAQVYSNLVNAIPTNTTAAAAGLKLVDPGNPRNSFLFAKANHGLDANLTLAAGQDPTNHDSFNALTQTQREMIRQWIVFGAIDTGTYVLQSTIDTFYVAQGGQPRTQVLAPPPVGEGVQLYFGPLFMLPGVEFEYNNKSYLNNSGTVDVTRMVTQENVETHHFAIYNFLPGHDTLFEKGLHKVVGISDEAYLFFNATVVAQWPRSMDVTYPTGTALVWEPNSVLCLDYHLINYESTVIAAEAYMNVYFRPHQSSTIAIQTAPVRYGGDNVDELVVPNNSTDTTFRIVQANPDSTFYWNIISMQAHTHKLGTDFYVWTRKSTGQKDSLIYDGRKDPTYSYDQGTYIWNDPPYRRFDPPLPVYMTNGLIHEASYFNSGADTVHFGLSTTNEMFVTFVLYYESQFPASGINQVQSLNNIKTYPNPASDVEYFKLDDDIDIQKGEMQFYDALGRKVLDIQDIDSHTSNTFATNVRSLPEGCYAYRLISNGNEVGSGKIMVQR